MKRGGVFTKRFFRLLSVRVENAPDEGYSLDLVAEGAYAGHTYGSGDAWVSRPCTRTALSSSVTVDRAARSLSVPPAWAGSALQFFSTLLPSLLVEGLLLLAFGFSWKQNKTPFLLVNFSTQGALALSCSVSAVQNGVSFWSFFLLLPAEAVIALAEAGLYTRLLTGRSKRRAFAYRSHRLRRLHRSGPSGVSWSPSHDTERNFSPWKLKNSIMTIPLWRILLPPCSPVRRSKTAFG